MGARALLANQRGEKAVPSHLPSWEKHKKNHFLQPPSPQGKRVSPFSNRQRPLAAERALQAGGATHSSLPLTTLCLLAPPPVPPSLLGSD